ncbi:MAG TPA: GH32 C-terminal domain-containing protein, partial [Marinobacter sp.]|nr:GH32 C-terminal domain-containing protein [Marinobacter sp.]
QLVNTFRRFDESVGVATSPSFSITQPYINMLVGGGQHPHQNLPREGVIGYPEGELFATFDGADWNGWQASGSAFTDGLGNDSKSPFDGWYDGIQGILGTSLLHSFHPDAGGDGATGTLTSPTFTIEHDFINFKAGGGYHPLGDPGGATVIKLVVNGVTERWTTGVNMNQLFWRYWDVSDLKGQSAQLVVEDQHSGGWGQIQIDHILFSDASATTVQPGVQLIAGFDGPDYSGWTKTGTAFDAKHASGGWGPIPNYIGTGLAHSYSPSTGDAATGTLTSADFTLDKPYLNLLVGGGNKPAGHPDGEARVYLVVNGTEVASATGADSATMAWHSWDLRDYQGQSAHLVISDQSTAGWGQVQVDHVIATDTPVVKAPTGTLFEDFETDLAQWTAEGDASHFRVSVNNRCTDGEDLPESGVEGEYLLNSFYCGTDGTVGFKDSAVGTLTSQAFTVQNDYIHLKMGGGSTMTAEVLVDGQVVAEYQQPDNSWALTWGTIDVSQYRGQSAQLRFVDDNTGAWGFFLADQILFSDDAQTQQQATTAETAVNLKVNGEVVRSATGKNSGGLDWVAWDVADLIGQDAVIEIVDMSRDGWGHILVDDIRFTQQPALDAPGRADWVDWGKDFYAGITFFDYPGSAPAWLAWSNNWQYAGDIPTGTFRGAQSLVRTIGLTDTGSGLALTQQPVGINSQRLDSEPYRWPAAVMLNSESVAFNHQFEAGSLLDIELVLEPRGADEAGLNIQFNAEHRVEIVYDREAQTLALDRTESGAVDFNDAFPGVHAAPVTLDEAGRLTVRLILDWSMLEVLAQNGQVALTDRLFPTLDNPIRIDAFARNGDAVVHALKVRRLESIWAD